MSHLSKQNWREILYKTSNIRWKLKIDSSKSLVTDNIIWNLKNQGMEVYSGLKSYKHKTIIKSKKMVSIIMTQLQEKLNISRQKISENDFDQHKISKILDTFVKWVVEKD